MLNGHQMTGVIIVESSILNSKSPVRVRARGQMVTRETCSNRSWEIYSTWMKMAKCHKLVVVIESSLSNKMFLLMIYTSTPHY